MSAANDSPPPDAGGVESTLTSGVPYSPADERLRDAIAAALRAEPNVRAELFAKLLRELEDFVTAQPDVRPWTHSVFAGTDGSRIFRGATGRSIVIDAAGTMWRARSYEDFDTTYTITNTDCTIASLTPRYEHMERFSLERLMRDSPHRSSAA
jgi:hypothetical protein